MLFVSLCALHTLRSIEMDITPERLKRPFEDDGSTETQAFKYARKLPAGRECIFDNQEIIKQRIALLENMLTTHKLERTHVIVLETQLKMAQKMLKSLYIKQQTK